tara:strand:- start:129 stop:1634 length:1506 start_codon:yes stop_codon:yes gene_type:complete
MDLLLKKDYVFKRNRIGRIGIIDVGSNSVRLVVFEGFSRSPSYFFNEKVLCGLGKGIQHKNMLNKLGVAEAIRAIKRFVAITKKMNLTALVGVATAAVRNASDGKAFVKKVKNETNLRLYVASGREEAEFSANGVLLGWPDASGLVCDIGGSSLEVADLLHGLVGYCATSPLGALSLSEFRGTQSELNNFIKTSVEKLCSGLNSPVKNLYLVGGSFRVFAKLDIALSNYPLKVLHEYALDIKQALRTAYWVLEHEVPELANKVDSSIDRLMLLPMAARVLIQLIGKLKPTNIYFSSYGLREGILFYQMPERIKNLDPLIEACRYQEGSSARFPGFGEKLFNWILPIFSNLEKDDIRLYRAACLLHDTTWKAHPDYRAEMSFETVTRTNLGGINHQGRIFLALALMSRYKKICPSKNLEVPLQILGESRAEEAIILGRAMRLGAMVSGTSVVNLKKCKLYRKNKILYLNLKKSGRDLAAGLVERRLKALADGMNLKYSVLIT